MRSSSRPVVPLFRLLAPGLHLKRWLGLLVVGLVLLSLGIAYLLADVYRTGDFPSGAEVVTLQFLPRPARALLFGILGLFACWLALQGLYRSLAEVVVGEGHTSLLDMVYRHRLRQSGPRVVCIGGGTGMPSVLRGLKHHTANITAIVTVGDDGGSSGRLRREHGILPPGDFRNNIVALAEVEPLMERLFQYRFSGDSALGGHSFGNLFVLAMSEVTGNFEQALRETSRVLAVKGTILPSTLDDVVIGARFVDGTEAVGESQVPEVGKPIEHVFMRPPHAAAQPEAVGAILEADLVVLGPGSLYTSVLPNLLVDGIAKAVLQSPALKVYVCNVATQPGETDGYGVAEHVSALVRHLPGRTNVLDYVVATRHPGGMVPPEPNVALVTAAPGPLGSDGPRVVVEDVVRDDKPLRHDPEKLARVLLRLYEAWRPARG